MIKQLIKYLRNYANGEAAEVDVFVTWWEFAAVLIIIGLIIRWIWM